MNEPKTLDEARDLLVAQEAKISELSNQGDAHQSALNAAIESLTTEHEKQVNELKSSLLLLNQELEEKDNALLDARNAIVTLEKARLTIESRARELLAAQGGPPLAVDAQDAQELTASDLRNRLATEKDPQMRSETYWKLKELEEKAKGHRNGTK